MGSDLSFLLAFDAENAIQKSPNLCQHKFCEQWRRDDFRCVDCQTVLTRDDDMAEERRTMDSIRDDSMPEDGINCGVTIQFLVDFANACNCWNMSTRQVRRRFIMPATRTSRCRFVDLPQMASVIGRATTYVSHTWGAKFGDLVTALCDGNADRSRVVWIDLFAVRQWPSHKPDHDFGAVLKQCKSFLIVCSAPKLTDSKKVNPSDASVAFLRLWCLVELLEAMRSGVAIVIKAGSQYRSSSVFWFKSNVDLLDTMSFLVDVGKAETSVPADRERLLSEFSEADLTAANETIRAVLRRAYRANLPPAVHCAACGDQSALKSLLENPSMYVEKVASCGYTDLLRELLPAVFLKGENWLSMPLKCAVEGGHTGCVALLIQHGADVAFKWGTHTVLMTAAMNGHAGTVRYLVESGGSEVNTADSSGNTALTWAAARGHAACVTVLLEFTHDADGSAMIAAARANNQVCMQLLLKNGGYDINDRNSSSGNTALMEAAERGRCDCVELLLARGWDVNAKTTWKVTALMLAAKNGHGDVVNLLIQRGADVSIVNGDGWNALMTATRHLNADNSSACVQSLIQAGAKVHSWKLVAEYKESAIEQLVVNGVDVNCKDAERCTALVAAASFGHLKAVRFLLQSGADERAKDASGRTAVTTASQGGHSACVALLSKEGGSRKAEGSGVGSGAVLQDGSVVQSAACCIQ